MVFPIFIILFIAVALFIYIMIYKRSINKRLAESHEGIKSSHKAMMSPLKFACILLISVLLAYMLLVTAAYTSLSFFKGTGTSSETVEPRLMVKSHFSGEDSMLELLDPSGVIPGYTWDVIERDGFRFTVYYDHTMCSDFPRILIYTEYTAESDKDKTPFVEVKYGYDMKKKNLNGTYYLDFDQGNNWLTVCGNSVEGHLYLDYYLLSGVVEAGKIPLDAMEKSSDKSGRISIPISFDIAEEGQK